MFSSKYVRMAASLLMCTAAGTWAATSRADPPPSESVAAWRRPVGPVRLALTAVLVAPGKSSGQPWDGLMPLPAETRQGLQQGLPAQTVRAIFALFVDGSGAGAATRFAPWATNAFLGSIAAPDVRVDVLVDGRPVSRVRTQAHTFTPSWPVAPSVASPIGANQQIDVDAWDIDVMRDDHIGVCTIQGMPLVDRNGYARARDFTCNGQLWGVRLRVLADSYEPAGASAAEAPPPSAQQPAPATADPVPPSASSEIRRGGVGESCTRTDDCNSPLRCINHACSQPSE